MRKQAAFNPLQDFVDGALQNSFGRPVNIQIGDDGGEMKLASDVDFAILRGAVLALAEAEFTVKEASEYLGVGEDVIEAVVDTLN